jgi:probable F420-dependent oxidoreductase
MSTTDSPPGGGVRIGVALPQVFSDGRPDPQMIADYAARAESLGIDSLWVQSQLIGQAAVLDPITLLAFAAAATERIRLGASVLIAPEYHPVQLAKQLSSLDRLSAGRLTVGLGTGSPNSTYEIKGLPRDRAVRRLVECIEVMRALWTEPQASYEGDFYAVDALPMEPKPVQRPGPPLWLGGRSENARRRAARYGSGWMGPGASTMEMFRSQVAELRGFLDEAGRGDAPFTIAKRLYVAVEESEAAARERMRTRLQRYGHQHGQAEQVAVYGTSAQVADGLAAAAGFLESIEGPGDRLLMLSPIHDFPGQLDALGDILRSSGILGRPVPAATGAAPSG